MTAPQKTEQWHLDRAMKISGSRIASVMETPGAFKSRKQLMEEFIRDYQGIEPDPVPEFLQIMFDWGNEHESDCEEMLLESVGGAVRHFGFMPHPTIDYVGMSPDGVLTDADGKKYLVEYKCPYMSKIPEKPPAKYLAQLQLGMEVMDIDDGILAYWWLSGLGDPQLQTFHVERDKDWWAEAEYKIHQFWEEFLDKRDQPIAETVDDPVAIDIAERLSHVVTERLALSKIEKDLKAQLQNYVGDKDAVIGKWKATHVVTRGSVDMDKLVDEFDFDPDQYRKPDRASIKFTQRKED